LRILLKKKKLRMNLRNNKKCYIRRILRIIWPIFRRIPVIKKNMRLNWRDNLKFKMIFNGIKESKNGKMRRTLELNFYTKSMMTELRH